MAQDWGASICTEEEVSWTEIDAPLTVGDTVLISEAFLSADGDIRVELLERIGGQVLSVDDDGDYKIEFPSLRGLASTDRWILSKRHANMLKLAASLH